MRGLFMENLLSEIICYIFIVTWFAYWYITRYYNYWKERRVPYIPPEFPFGSIKNAILTRTYFAKHLDEMYKQFPGERFFGFTLFRSPVLVIKDLTLVKEVMVKEFQHFAYRPIYNGSSREYIMNYHLLNLNGKDWKHTRTTLLPAFSNGRIKSLFELMNTFSGKLKEKLENLSERGNSVDVKNILTRFSMEVTACYAFGLDSNTLNDENAELYHYFKVFFRTPMRVFIRRILFIRFSSIVKLFRLTIIRKELIDFVTKTVEQTLSYRQKNNVRRNDVLGVLTNVHHNKRILEENERAVSNTNIDPSKDFTVEQIAANVFMLYIAGFEAPSTLMTFCLYELCLHQDIQKQLYENIKNVVEDNGGKITIESLKGIPFLDQVINETLRLYGTAQFLSRVCTQNYKIPDSDLVLEKGTTVVIPLCSLHRDPRYYSEPDEFKPDRFALEEKSKMEPFAFIPFGKGPRNCLGEQFGRMQAKIGIATIILNFHVQLCPEQEVPIEMSKTSLFILPANPVLLKFNNRNCG